jgi:hypothetical protein
MPLPNCTDCTWCYHPPMAGSTDPNWHISIPNPGCITNPWPIPPPPPPCSCPPPQLGKPFVHDPNCLRHQ